LAKIKKYDKWVFLFFSFYNPSKLSTAVDNPVINYQ